MNCSCCNRMGMKISMHKLKDGMICNECIEKLPYIIEEKIGDYGLDDVKTMIELFENKYFKNGINFYTTSSYGNLRIDSLHYLIAIGENSDFQNGYSKDKRVLVVPLKDIVNLSFDVDVHKATADEIRGDVKFSFETKAFRLCNTLIKENEYIRPHAVENGSAVFTLPSEAQLIRSEIVEMINQDRIKEIGTDEEDQELLKAMGLYMVEQGAYTVEDLKKQRNRLMKVFHPDVDSTNGAEERTKIVIDAYKLLEERIE